jgi:mono/diheme cytochrome c family protein
MPIKHRDLQMAHELLIKEHQMKTALRHVLVLIAASAAPLASPATAADANHGADLAQRWCAACHLVEGGQKQAVADVPSFAAIAHRSDFTPEKVAFFLLDPHPNMPNFPLSRTEAADIAAYIGSLRK